VQWSVRICRASAPRSSWAGVRLKSIVYLPATSG
jgi:hypothetical protein